MVSTESDGPTYYVNYDVGADTYSGTNAAAPWKHAPGDPEAEGHAANTPLAPGSTVLFAGGVVYQGTIVLDWSGTVGRPILYDGDAGNHFGQGRAVLDGQGRERGPLANQYGFVGGETWNGFKDVGVSQVVIDNFEIRDQRYIWNDTGGGWNNGPQGIAFAGAGSNVTVENCWIHDVQPIAPAVNGNSEDMGSLNAWTSVAVTNGSFTDSNVTLAQYAGTPGSLAPFKIYVGWGVDDYTIASAYLGPYWSSNNTLRVYQDLNLTLPGWNTANSNPVGRASAYGYSIFNMTAGPMYGKESSDISVSTHDGTTLRNNTLADAGTGIGLSQDNNSLVEGNDISNVSWGIAGGSGEIPAAAMVNVTIAFNHIHDFFPYVRFGYWSGWHGDGIYFFAGSGSYAPLRHILFEGNDFTGYIPEATADIYAEDADYENITIYDNVFAASGAWMIRFSADPGSIMDRIQVYNNDFVMAPLDQSPAMLFQGGLTNVSLRNNLVWIPSGYGAVFSFDPAGLAPFGSDDNLLGSDYAYTGDVGYDGSELTLAQWVGSNVSFPHDQQSVIDQDPGFVNYPDFEVYLSGGSRSNVTLQAEDPPVNPYVRSTFRVGDRVEYDDDGLVRTVTAVGNGAAQPWVRFTPALTAPPTVGDFLTDWGNDSNFTLDLHVRSSSPAIGTGVNLAGQVPDVDAAGNLRPLSGPWDIGAYVYVPVPPTTLESLLVSPSSVTIGPNSTQKFSAVAVCSGACPAGITYSWALLNGIGVLNATRGSTVIFTSRAASGNEYLSVNATLNGSTVAASVVSIVVATPSPGPAAPTGGNGVQDWLEWAALLVIVAIVAAAVAVAYAQRRRPPPTSELSGDRTAPAPSTSGPSR